MSMELYVLSSRQLAAFEAWQQAINAASLRVHLKAAGAVADQTGFLPVAVGGAETGFELAHWDAQAMKAEDPDYFTFVTDQSHILAFRWGGDFFALFAVYAAASAYARAVGGTVFDCETGEILTPDATAALALIFEKDLPAEGG